MSPDDAERPGAKSTDTVRLGGRALDQEVGRAGRARRTVIERLAKAHPAQLQVSTRRGQPRPRPLGLPVFSPWVDWHWRSLESHIGIAQRVPIRALAQFARRPWRAPSMTILGQIARLDGLESLRLLAPARRNRARALEHLARLPFLTDLRFGAWSIPCAGFERDDLGFLRALRQLRVLALWGCDAELEPLQEVVRLRDLRLTHAVLTPARLAVLGELGALEILDLGNCSGLDHRTGRSLASMGSLRQLGLSSIDAGPALLEVIGTLHGLELLDLRAARARDVGIEDDGLARLASLLHLTHLDLCGNRRITDVGARTLGRLLNLTWLNLSGCHITDRGLAHLHALTGLRFLELGVSEVSDRSLEALRRSLADPDAEIRRTTLKEYEDQMDRRF